ncbi:hypothetical protein ACFQJD_18065 [Haloplanus sp. GCM10025708]|uniref:hypothetical protein n=1 Tax=Haloplanus sp. GCM10025708 TaxID=3252679 RepID=UPI003619C556
MNGPVGPERKPDAAKNGTGGWWVSGVPSTVTTRRSDRTSRTSPARWVSVMRSPATDSERAACAGPAESAGSALRATPATALARTTATTSSADPRPARCATGHDREWLPVRI